MHRHFLRKLSQNRDFIQIEGNKLKNPFHFECRNWHLHNNPQGCYSIVTPNSNTINNIKILTFVQTTIISVTILENSINK